MARPQPSGRDFRVKSMATVPQPGTSPRRPPARHRDRRDRLPVVGPSWHCCSLEGPGRPGLRLSGLPQPRRPIPGATGSLQRDPVVSLCYPLRSRRISLYLSVSLSLSLPPTVSESLSRCQSLSLQSRKVSPMDSLAVSPTRRRSRSLSLTPSLPPSLPPSLSLSLSLPLSLCLSQ